MNARSLGEKIKETRLTRKMTQSDVAGDFITRNMLSQIENGSANPSIKTIEYIARKLKKPVSYFMDDTVAYEHTDTGNPDLTNASEALSEGRYDDVIKILGKYDDNSMSLSNENLIDILSRAYENSANIYQENGNHSRACELRTKALETLEKSAFSHTAHKASLLLDIMEVSETIGVPVPGEIQNAASYLDKIEYLLYRKAAQSALHAYKNGDYDTALSQSEYIIISDSSDDIKAKCSYIKASILCDREPHADEAGKILELLDYSYDNLPKKYLSLYKKEIFRQKARLLSLIGNYEEAYKFLEMASGN